MKKTNQKKNILRGSNLQKELITCIRRKQSYSMGTSWERESEILCDKRNVGGEESQGELQRRC